MGGPHTMYPMMMPPGFSAPNHHPMFAGVDPMAAPPPHLPGSMGAIAAQKHAMAEARGPTQHRFQPYEDNGGTTIGISGKDFAILGSDTRLSRGYSILCRDSPKQVQLSDNCVLISAGMKADRDMLHKTLKTRLTMYEHQHGKPMSTPAIAQLLSTTLYHRRFFPIYTFNVLGGLDENGQGCIFTYDAIGSYERVSTLPPALASRSPCHYWTTRWDCTTRPTRW